MIGVTFFSLMFSIIFTDIRRMALDYAVVFVMTHFLSLPFKKANMLAQHQQQPGQINVGCEETGCDTIS